MRSGRGAEARALDQGVCVTRGTKEDWSSKLVGDVCTVSCVSGCSDSVDLPQIFLCESKEQVYLEKADYLCDVRYLVEVNLRMQQTVVSRCSAHTGSYVPVMSGAEQCVPVVCANVPDVSNAERSNALSKVVFRAEASWQYKPGFSTDHVVGGNKDHSQHEPSVTTVMIALGIFVDRTASVGTSGHQRAFFWMTARVIATLVPN